jgi:hypothetical protein
MLGFNRVYRFEDIDDLTDGVANPEFGFYNIFMWRGSFNCRHQWVKLVYKKAGQIRNDANSGRGLIDESGLGPIQQPNTVPKDQRKKVAPRVGSSFAEEGGLESACWEGYEPIGLKDNGDPNCVPIKMTYDDFEDSINDYPEGVRNEAKRAVEYADKNGWGSCGTQVGKTRASQLANGKPISVDTIKRMYSYLSRHNSDLKSSKGFDDGCVDGFTEGCMEG